MLEVEQTKHLSRNATYHFHKCVKIRYKRFGMHMFDTVDISRHILFTDCGVILRSGLLKASLNVLFS